MKRLHVYVDTSVIGGCEDEEFAEDTLKLWGMFGRGDYFLKLSDLTLQELEGAPEAVRGYIARVPAECQLRIPVTADAESLAESYLARGIVGPGSWADALHVALATVARADVLVSWNFKHIVNLNRIRMFNAVNLADGFSFIEIRTPREVLKNEEDI